METLSADVDSLTDVEQDARDIQIFVQHSVDDPPIAEAAFTRIVQRNQQNVLKFLGRLGCNYHNALDLCQDVFIAVATKAHQLRNPLAFKGWLKKISYHMAVNESLRKKKFLSLDSEDMQLRNIGSTGLPHAHDSEAPDRRLLQSEKIAMVRRAIAQLRNIDKEMIELFYNRKLSLLEIQRMLDIPMGTVKRRLFTARHRAKELLERLDAA
ncbi:MAG: sigma-70 family RNA polymerase sigma factor [Patescibacteria group bacterium]